MESYESYALGVHTNTGIFKKAIRLCDLAYEIPNPQFHLFDTRFQASDWPTPLYGQDYIATRWFGMLSTAFYSVFL